MEGFCRGCLIKYDEPSELLQYTEKNRRLFVYSTGLQVKRNDTFTFQLCKDCYVNMKISCKFKKLCRSSDKKFKNYIGLQDAGENMDFCTFLKNNDDALTIRFPSVIGNSTPANQISRDDDNDSTCTSIRNFMTDIMQGEEMPDTEARIIREVIEEEADVLEESLDSHWLQDDASIDTDFRLDFSFSPFSTPRSTHHGNFNTPKKSNYDKDENYFSPKSFMGKVENKENQSVQNKLNIQNEDAQDNDKLVQDFFTVGRSLDPIDIDENLMEIEQNITVDEELSLANRPQNYYVPRDEEPVQIEVSDTKVYTENASKVDVQCTIDKNLEKALKNDGKEFSLEDLLMSPPVVFPEVPTPSTPTITNILFGKKLGIETGEDSSQPKMGQCIEKYEDVQGDIDILEEFFKRNDKELDIENENKSEQRTDEKKEVDKKADDKKKVDGIADDKNKLEKNTDKNIKTKESKDEINNHEIIEDETNNDEQIEENKIKSEIKPIVDEYSVEDKFDIPNAFCKLCSKQFSTSRALRIHSTKAHQIKISNPEKYAYKHKLQVCDTCGKSFRDTVNFYKHKLRHKEENKIIKCERCFLTFSSQHKLDMHMTTHNGKMVKKPSGKQYVCNICGAISNHYNNYRIHKMRHTKSYTKTCEECGKGFFRSSDLVTHMRNHTGERPFECDKCPRAFSRRDALIRHIKKHIGERRYECNYCKTKFIAKKDLKYHILKSKRCIEHRDLMAKLENKKSQSQNGVNIIYATVADVTNSLVLSTEIEQ